MRFVHYSLVVALVGFACDGETPKPEATPMLPGPPEAPLENPPPPAMRVPSAATPVQGGDAVVDQALDQPAGAGAQLGDLQPLRTRAGGLRFTQPAINKAGTADALLDRLATAEEPTAVRVALAEALVRTPDDYGARVAQILKTEKEPAVRVALVRSLQRQLTPAAIEGLANAFQDPDPSVRTAAAKCAGMHPQGASLAKTLVNALDDSSPQVQAQAAWSAGVLQVVAAQPRLASLLADNDPGVRLNALRAMQRIDPTAAASLDQISVLQHDTDSRIRRVANELAGSKPSSR